MAPTAAMMEAMQLGSPASDEERAHLFQMMSAIREQLAMPEHEHGSFITAMAERDYQYAFIAADGINRRHFGVLVYYREIAIPNNLMEIRALMD
jgi:hypothetical protein